MRKYNTISRKYHLDATRIDIWEYPLSGPIDEQYGLLNRAEKDRADRFQFPHHREHFIHAHATLRKILSRYTDTAPESLEFNTNATGKPQLSTSPDLQFNLSHSKNLALLAVGYQHPLGIDLEFCSSRDYLGIAKTSFSPQECSALEKLLPCLQPLGFFSIWSQKEALIKACGLGLTYPTHTFTVPVLPHEAHLVLDPQHNKTWKMKPFLPKINCCAALCYEKEINEVLYITNKG